MIEKYTFGDTGTNIIVSQSGQVIAYKEAESVGTPITDMGFTEKVVTNHIMNPNGELFKYSLQGTKQVAIANKLDTLNWNIITTISSSEFKKEINSITRTVILIQIVI